MSDACLEKITISLLPSKDKLTSLLQLQSHSYKVYHYSFFLNDENLKQILLIPSFCLHTLSTYVSV
jgi:hypothetical protein